MTPMELDDVFENWVMKELSIDIQQRVGARQAYHLIFKPLVLAAVRLDETNEDEIDMERMIIRGNDVIVALRELLEKLNVD